ncbi:CDP-alcohol phosphatidyltransferase family protein [Photobacterium sp. SDRW27]|uniref:CDP-alcohol phosphatidyltransferase family protein n=1 Tax=Photobacterium obscurum TaxID=2829490 RepID=UPI00224487AB|nr:CDP-alcohol phosphatidyltransferase family protein [Photobacterium obscurum]MCW8328726.1 CDP-alcohol phosphatidyltransferase family protein [Photobacterium obscurum]
MTHAVIKLIPNALTTLRILLAAPIFLLILNEKYSLVLWLTFIAGISDGLDGWLARKWDVLSRFGAIADPLSDKVMLVSAYVAFAMVGLIPWWVTVIVIARDVVIVTGAITYHCLFGRYDMAPSFWGKSSTLVQIVFALMLITNQVYHVFPAFSIQLGLWLLILMAFISGGHYVYVWGGKALAQQRK